MARHPRWTFHFTPTSASWLNAVEGFFAKLTKQRLERGIFLSVVDLQAAINRFVIEHNAEPKPFTWTADPDKIIQAVRRGAPSVRFHPLAYHLRDVAVIDGSVYHGTLRFFISKHEPTQSVRSRDIERAALVSSFYGSKYFGHWLRDDCTAYVLANDLNIPPLCFQSPSGRHMEGYKSLFDQEWTPTLRGRVKHLTVFSDYHENRLKLQRYEKLRSFVAARFPDRDYRSYVYLKRGKDGATRAVKNEDEIIAALVKNGFVVIDTGLTPLDKLLEILVNARIVVSVEGSHVSHCVYSVPRDSGLLILQPPDKFAANHRRWTSCLGIRFGFVVGTINEPGYQFDLTEILQTIDLLDRAIR